VAGVRHQRQDRAAALPPRSVVGRICAAIERVFGPAVRNRLRLVPPLAVCMGFLLVVLVVLRHAPAILVLAAVTAAIAHLSHRLKQEEHLTASTWSVLRVQQPSQPSGERAAALAAALGTSRRAGCSAALLGIVALAHAAILVWAFDAGAWLSPLLGQRAWARQMPWLSGGASAIDPMALPVSPFSDAAGQTILPAPGATESFSFVEWAVVELLACGPLSETSAYDRTNADVITTRLWATLWRVCLADAVVRLTLLALNAFLVALPMCAWEALAVGVADGPLACCGCCRGRHAEGSQPGEAAGSCPPGGALAEGDGGAEAAAAGAAAAADPPCMQRPGSQALDRARRCALGALEQVSVVYRCAAWLPLWHALLASLETVVGTVPDTASQGSQGASSGADARAGVAGTIYLVLKIGVMVVALVKAVSLVSFAGKWRAVWAVPVPMPPAGASGSVDGSQGRDSSAPVVAVGPPSGRGIATGDADLTDVGPAEAGAEEAGDEEAGVDTAAVVVAGPRRSSEAGLAMPGAAASPAAVPPAAAPPPCPDEWCCPICHGRMTLPVALVPCGHRFCRQCATRWVENHQPNCPVCREAVSRSARPPDMSLANAGVSLWFMAM